MKFTLLAICLLSLHSAVHGLTESGKSSYDVSPGARCPRKAQGCCTQSPCSLMYRANGTWLTEQDRTATFGACTGVCSAHFRKCVEVCNCVARQTEVRSTRFCKCKLGVPRAFVRNSCVRRCIDARRICVDGCNTGKCALKAITEMEWKQEFKGRCDGMCRKQNGLETVCVNE